MAYAKPGLADHDVVVSVVNLDTSTTRGGRVMLPLEELGLGQAGYRVDELLTGHSEQRQEAYLEVSLDPGELPARIFRLSHDSVGSA